MIDIYHSRRNYHLKCHYYKVAGSHLPYNELVNSTTPNGIFYARRESGQYATNTQANNLFQFEVSTITLKTPDNVDLDPNDLVKFNDEIWIVQNSQRIYHTDNEYKKDPEFVIIYLRKGK